MSTYSNQFRSTYGRAPFLKAYEKLQKALNGFRLSSEADRSSALMVLYAAYVRMECVQTGTDADHAARVDLLNLVRPIVLA